MDCPFCDIVSGKSEALWVYEDDACVAFLDMRPLFPGHTLVVPREHHETLMDLPGRLVEPLFDNVRLLSSAVMSATGSEGIYVAINNRVSQSVPHLHVHIVPRNKGDGLKGFFWPRGRYAGEQAARDMQARIREAVQSATGKQWG